MKPGIMANQAGNRVLRTCGETKADKMTWSKQTDSIMAIFWIALGFTISIWSATFPFGRWESIGPAIIPLACGLVLISLGIILLLQTCNRKEKPAKYHVSIIPQGAAFKRVVLSLGGLLLSAVIFDLLGFILTLFLLILFLMRAIQPLAWRVVIFYALVFTLGSYLFFKVLLRVTLPQGFLGF